MVEQLYQRWCFSPTPVKVGEKSLTQFTSQWCSLTDQATCSAPVRLQTFQAVTCLDSDARCENHLLPLVYEPGFYDTPIAVLCN